MSDLVKITFAPLTAPSGGVLVVFAGSDLKAGAHTLTHLRDVQVYLSEAAETLAFKGKLHSAMDLVRPPELKIERLLVIGAQTKADKPLDFVMLGGYVAGRVGKGRAVSVMFEGPEGDWSAAAASEFALGYRLRTYKFDRYKTKKSEPGDETGAQIGGGGDPRRRFRRGQARAPAPRARRRGRRDGAHAGQRARQRHFPLKVSPTRSRI